MLETCFGWNELKKLWKPFICRALGEARRQTVEHGGTPPLSASARRSVSGSAGQAGDRPFFAQKVKY